MEDQRPMRTLVCQGALVVAKAALDKEVFGSHAHVGTTLL